MGDSATCFDDIRDAFTFRTYAPGQVIFREGDPSETFCFIKSGRALVSRKTASGDDEPLSVLREGQFFGEIGLLEEMERTASVRALMDLEVFELPGTTFRTLLESNPGFSLLISRIGRKRLLLNTPLFRELDDDRLETIQKLVFEKDYNKGETIFKENEAPDALYIIVKGGVRVSKRARGGKEVVLARLGPGETFGEMGLIEEETRSATVMTEEPSRFLVLPREGFQSAVKTDALLSFTMLKLLSRRLREQSNELTSVKATSFFKGISIIARSDRCLSCRACEVACAVSKSSSGRLYEAISEEPRPVTRMHLRRSAQGSQPVLRPEHCLHCRKAPCLAKCKLDAIKRDAASGTIVISQEKCKGCALCAKACPYSVISIVRSEGKRRVALKCTFCAEHPSGPACVRSCPTKALVVSLSAASVL